jgi:hypothetical protein
MGIRERVNDVRAFDLCDVALNLSDFGRCVIHHMARNTGAVTPDYFGTCML